MSAATRYLLVDQSGQPGGAELCLADVAEGMGGEASILLLGEGPFRQELERREIPVETLGLPESLAGMVKSGAGGSGRKKSQALLDLMVYLPRLRRALKRADLLYFNTPKALVLGGLAHPEGSRPKVFHLHDLWTPEHFSQGNLFLLRTLAARCDLVIANSEATAKVYRDLGGRNRVEVIPNGFRCGFYDKIPAEEWRPLRQQWGAGKQVIWGVFGRLARWKGQHLLLEAAADFPDVTIWIVGSAFFTEDDRAYAEELRRLAKSLGMENRVVFTGFLANPAPWMKACDAIVHTSLAAEPFGRVVAEAMLCGRPVVAARAGGPAEIVRNGETGLLYEMGSVGDLRAALRHLLQNPAAAADLARAGRNNAVATYGLVEIQQRTRLILQELQLKYKK